MNWRRLLFCDLLGWHVGDIESGRVEWGRAYLTVHFVACSRCGELAPLDLEPRHVTEDRLDLDSPAKRL